MSDEFPTFGGTGVRDGVSVPREREELRAVLAGLLGAEPDELADDDNLVGLGLDSVAVMRLVGRWRRAGVDVTYERLLAAPTLLGWLDVLSAGEEPTADEEWPGEAVVAQADPDAPFPLTPVQHAYWIGRHEAQVLGGVGCHGYFEFDAPGGSTVDAQRLDRAVRALVRRHGMLRARVLDDGTQVITPDGAWPGLTVHDLRAAAPEDAAAALLRVRENAAHRRMDVRAGEVFDVALSLSPGVTRLHLGVDLIVADVLSIQVLMADLAAAYETNADLPVIPHSFPRYLAERKHDLQRRRALAAAREHWAARLDTMPATGPQLPLALDPAQVKVPRFHRRLTRLAPDGWARLSRRCAEHHLTPSMVLATAFAAVLGRWSADPRFLLNIPLFDRQHDDPAVGELVADFTNLLVLEVDTAGTPSFADRARAVTATFTRDVSHAVHSAVDVLRELGRTRGTPASAPVVFASSLGGDFVGPAFRDRFGDLSWMVSQTPQVWLDHQLYEQAGGLLLTWDTVEELFPEGVVGDMFAAYERLVGWLAAEDSDWAAPGPELMPSVQDEVRAEVNNTAGPVPEGLLHQGFLAQAERTPDAVAVIDVDGPATYSEVLAGAVAVAAALGDSVAGTVVGVLAEKSRYQVSSVLGVLLAGAAYLPLAAGQPAVRRDAILADAGVSAVVTTTGDCPDDLPSQLVVVEADLLEPADHAVPAPIARPGELAYLIYTSGSTGAPKGVMTTHQSALNTVVDVNTRFGVSAGDRVLGLAGLGFDLSVYDLFGPPAAGAALVLPDPDRRADPSHWAELVAEHGVTLWNSVPAQLQMLDNYLDYEDIEVSSLRLALLSGDWIPVPLPDSIRAKVPGLEVVSLGGATEAAIWSVLFPIGEIDRAWSSIPYGSPMLNQDLAVFDVALRPCPDWVTGELYIGGAGVAEGYLGDPGRTAERFVTRPQDGRRYYRTGDLARYRPDGVLEFLGRADNQVKIRGHRIEPGEVEHVLRGHPGVASATVVVDGDRPMERTLAAFVTPGPREGGADEAERARAWEAAKSVVEDSGRAVEFGRAVERAQLSAMADVLVAAGLFADGRGHTAEEVVAAVGAAPAHHGLLRRWLIALTDTGLLTRDGETYRELVTADTESCWAAAEALREDRVCPPERFEHMKISAGALPGLLRDEVDQVRLLFPEGSLDRARAAYGDTLAARHLNTAAAQLVAALAKGRERLRVLELGAGVGATTGALLGALDGMPDCAVDYLFTDVSPFFLNEARTRFGDRGDLRYAMVDLNADPRGQGLEPSGFDVIVAANVLHNAAHVGEALERVRTLLAPAGWLVLTEATREGTDLLTSMGFLVHPDTPDGDWLDERRGCDRVLLSAEDWTTALTAAGGGPVLAVPSAGDGDQHLLAARFKADRCALEPGDLLAHAAAALPEHMVPARAQVVDELPLTGNGKLDHATLRAWLRPAHGGGQAEGEPPRDELEQAVADVFAGLLQRPHLGRDQDFFAEGGDSLLVTQAVNRLRAEVGGAATLGFDGLLRVVLDRATPAAVAQAVREAA